MTRQANAVDFWRGLALIFIFINHIPGIYYARFTHANYSLSDSADLFVFLAGWEDGVFPHMRALGHVTRLAGQQQENAHRLAISFRRDIGPIALRGADLDADADGGQ